jgi:hypothetical protein
VPGCLLALAVAAAAGAASTGDVGYDISFPQCNGAFPSGGAFGIVGVNGGRPYLVNPCLGTGDGPSELAWAGMGAQLYANTADPGPALSSRWPNGQTAPRQCNTPSNPGDDTPECHYDYGWNAAADSYQNAVDAYISLGWAPAGSTRTPVPNQWWLDVETANSWTASPTRNVTSLHGEVDYLVGVGAASVGFYSSTADWQTITGGTADFAAGPSWLAGASSLADAQSRCGTASFTGGAVSLVQFPSGGFDADYRCAGPPTAVLVRFSPLGTVVVLEPPTRTLENDTVGYSLRYPRGWKITGQVVATAYAKGADCQSVRVVDFAPPPSAGPSAQVRQSFVQICWRRVTDGSSLEEFMRSTYGDRVLEIFEKTSLGGARAYRTKGAIGNRTFFLQNDRYRLQVVATVTNEPAKSATRLAQVGRILGSFSLER